MYTRLYTGTDGDAHIEDLESPVAGGGRVPLNAGPGITFSHSPPGYFSDWHTAPRRQYIVTLSGEVEVGLKDGTTRRYGPGDVNLAEDLTGRGHTTRVVSSEPRVAIIIPLAD